MEDDAMRATMELTYQAERDQIVVAAL